MATAEKQINQIWGGSHLEKSAAKRRMIRITDPNIQIKRALNTFVREQIEQWNPDEILVVERSGTAILRALRESAGLTWPWSRVISSATLEQVPPERLRDKRVLVFDDMMRSGAHLLGVLNRIDAYCHGFGITPDIRTAVFAVHEQSSDRLVAGNGQAIPHAAFYRDLAPNAYRKIGDRIVELLQRSGSLMLDTEHIEVRFRLQQGTAQLSDAFRRRADVSVFQSLGHRTNLTVLYPEDEAHVLGQDFPRGTRFTGIVRKCRVVQRQGNEFAIIPICYPSVLAEAEWETNRPPYLEGAKLGAGIATFYGVALASALTVLSWAIRDLSVAGTSLGNIELPQQDANVEGYDLEHLRVMHPTVDVAQLTSTIASVATKAISDGVRLRRIRHQPRPMVRYTDKELHFDAIRLLQLIRLTLDDRCLEGGPSEHAMALLPGEIFSLGRRMGWQDAKISTLFDILIDEAYLVPRVDQVVADDGKRIVRTFEPVGELVSELVRRFTTQWGLPRGF